MSETLAAKHSEELSVSPVKETRSSNRLEATLTSLILRQFREFWYYYLLAFVSLVFLHLIQSWLPFFARDMAQIATSGVGEISTWKLFAAALGIIFFRTSSRLLFFYPARILQKLLRVEMLDRLENSSPTRYRHYPVGQLYQIIASDMDQLRALIGFALLPHWQHMKWDASTPRPVSGFKSGWIPPESPMVLFTWGLVIALRIINL